MEKRMSKFNLVSAAIFGVLLPAFTLIVEAASHMCAQSFFDPIPTWAHVAIIGLVPVVNSLVLTAVWKNEPAPLGKLLTANALVIGICMFYTLLFLPLLPLSVIAILWLGMGFLPLAPLLCLIYSVVCRRHLLRLNNAAPAWYSKIGWGLGLAVLLLISLEAPQTWTRIGMQMSSSANAEDRASGIRFLRWAGDRELMLRMCYFRTGRATDLVSFLFSLRDQTTSEDARKIFNRVTGKPFNAVPPPPLPGRLGYDFPAFDQGLGGDSVAGRVDNLRLVASRIDGSIDAHAALGYLEWTMVFENQSRTAREARTQILLPPGGVVSRLTLWVHGEEREAAFAATGKVREAYTKVVNQRRDPVLVTAKGPDRILVQCFPVQPRSEMKIRLGITLPLALEQNNTGRIFLPVFLGRNFGIPETTRHAVWLESQLPMKASPELTLERNGNNGFSLRGMLPPSGLSDLRAGVECSRTENRNTAWAPNPADEKESIIYQYIENVAPNESQNLIIVLDGSMAMAAAQTELAKALKQLPLNTPVALVLAADNVQEILPLGPVNEDVLSTVAMFFKQTDFAGGRDNLPALAHAWEMAASGKDSSLILWIHGPQPVSLAHPQILVQKWERRPQQAKIVDLQTSVGPNRIAEAFLGRPGYQLFRFARPLDEVLISFFKQWENKTSGPVFVREQVSVERLSSTRQKPAAEEKTSIHLVKLWAHRQILDLCAQAKAANRDKAVGMAVRHQLVTPVSGAVVLETDQQYKDAGLTPGDPAKVPIIPEPELLAVMGVGLVVLLWLGWVRRRSCPVA